MYFKALAAAVAALTFVATTAAIARPAAHDQDERSQSDSGEWRMFKRASTLQSDDDNSSQRRARPARQSARNDDGDGESRRSTRPQRVSRSNDDGGERHSGVGPRPGAWCGWYMRTRHGGGPEFNLAANWRRWGSPSSPQIGAIVVWPHHVGEIVGRADNGQWIVLSGNDSGAVRRRPRSIEGAVVRS